MIICGPNFQITISPATNFRLIPRPYLKFVTSTTSGAGVKIFRPVSKKCELVCFSVKIMNFVFFGVKKSGISVFLVSVENGAGVNKMTNMTYARG